jgi:hypothetical protein
MIVSGRCNHATPISAPRLAELHGGQWDYERSEYGRLNLRSLCSYGSTAQFQSTENISWLLDIRGCIGKVAIYEVLVLRAEAPWGIYKYPQF